MCTGIFVVEGFVPGIQKSIRLLEVTPGRVVSWLGVSGGFVDQGIESLSGVRVASVVHAVELECTFELSDFCLGRGGSCLVDLVADTDTDNTHEESHDENNRHDFN